MYVDLFSFLNSNEKENFNLQIPVTVFGELSSITQTMSKARLRLFYKGINRNGSYIDDEFADKLLATLPYAPVKGIYDTDADDYTDHGIANDQGRIYGVVPEQPNVSWKPFLDEDGSNAFMLLVMFYYILHFIRKQIKLLANLSQWNYIVLLLKVIGL